MTSLIRQMLGIWVPVEYKIYCRVLVAGQDVMMTASQARRYEELKTAKKA